MNQFQKVMIYSLNPNPSLRRVSPSTLSSNTDKSCGLKTTRIQLLLPSLITQIIQRIIQEIILEIILETTLEIIPVRIQCKAINQSIQPGKVLLALVLRNRLSSICHHRNQASGKLEGFLSISSILGKNHLLT
jgi:hypothetical protein